MASSYLVVHVGDAKVLSSSSKTSGTSYYYVELRFNGQSARTEMKEMKEKAVWNQMFRFHTREQQGGGDDDDDDDDDDADDHPSGGLHLEAAVYSIDETNNSETLLGKALVDEKDFDSHSSQAGLFQHDLMKSSSSDHPEITRVGGPSVVNGKLTLKVFHSAADDKTLFEMEEDNRGRQNKDGGVDNVKKKAFKFLFSNKDHRDAYKTSSAVGNTALLQPGDGDAAVPREINPRFERGKVVERMQFLFVLVVKARELPDVDAYGGLDPFVEVKFGAHVHNKRVTNCLKRDGNPEWNKTFAFSLPNGKAPPSSGVDVAVKDGDLLRDELVGKLYFYLTDIPVRHPDDPQPEPTWHPLMDEGGKATLGKASLLLAIWIGSQADEAYRHAWKSPYGPKVYENPRLWCLRVTIVEVQGVVACDDNDAGSARARSLRDKLFCKVRLENQVRKTRLASKTMQTTSSGSYEWMEDLVFIAAQPFFESNLQVDVKAASSSSGEEEEEVIGQLSIPLVSMDKRDATAYDRETLTTPPATRWYDLKNPLLPSPRERDLDGSLEGGVGGNMSHMRIRLGSQLDGGYHIGHDPQGHMDDTRPAERQLWKPPIARAHLGILCATGLPSIADGSTTRCGRSTAPNPYCVAKYGDKWVRTRTIFESSDPVFNEEYTWDVYDIATVLKVGIFDHCSLEASSARHRIGKVLIHLSRLETDRVYAFAYPLVTLSRIGVIKTGELHLAVKISPPSTMNTLRMYASPTLPKMHYVQPLEEEQQDFFSAGETAAEGYKLWLHAARILALRLDRMEPPLRSEVVAYLCNAESCNNSSWSLRRSKANFFRLMQVLASLILAGRWFGGVISWKNPLATLLIHAVFVLALWFPELILPLVLMYIVLVGVWNYRFRPRKPPHFNMRISYLDVVHPDELDEEFDTVTTSLADDGLLRMRYDRLRSIAGRIQTAMGDIVTEFERLQSFLSWKDPRVTAIFMHFLLLAAAVAYFVPYKKILVALAGFYIMRHPRFRRKTPSVILCFFLRAPSKRDELM